MSFFDLKNKLPQNFQANNDEFVIFEKYQQQHYQKPKIDILKNVRVSNNSVVFEYFKIFKESCINEENYLKYKKGFKFYLKYIFPQFNFSKKRFLLITDEWTSNYFHWHIYALQRLMVMKKNNLLDDAILLLPKKYRQYKFVLASLEKFGITKDKIRFINKKSNIKVKELVLVSMSFYNSEMPKKMGEILVSNTKNVDLAFGEKIYISRDEQVLRYVENEAELVKLLEKYGFKKVIMEKFSYDQQINISRHARYIISPHGAGLMNMLFMPENSALLEMATRPSDQGLILAYYILAQMLDIDYYYQKCEDAGKIRDFHHASLVVNLAKLEENLKLMLKNDSSKN